MPDTGKLLTLMQVINAREAIHREMLKLPRTVTYTDIAAAAGVSASTVHKFSCAPEQCKIETVAAIGEAVEKLRAREGQK